MAVNVVEVVPAGIVTELDPSGRSVLLLDSRTSIPPVGAAAFKVTAHVVDAPELKLLGLQTSWETEIICPRATPENKKLVIPVLAILLPNLNLGIITDQNKTAAGTTRITQRPRALPAGKTLFG